MVCVEERAKNKQERFTALLHHVNVDLLRDSYYGLKRNAATGVDGVTWKEYETGLEDRLKDLHGRVHRGAYRALPSKRVYIPKANGKQRPLGIAALEDKIVQSAVVTVLHHIYEEDFRGYSYGFRPGRSQHNALDALYVAIHGRKVNWILDMDLLPKPRQVLRPHEWPYRSRLAGSSLDEAAQFECLDHLMNGRRSSLKILLQVRFRGRAAVDL